jgi:hypothetical protein
LPANLGLSGCLPACELKIAGALKSGVQMRSENLVIRAVESTDAEGLTRLQNMPGFRFGTLRTPFQRLDTAKK